MNRNIQKQDREFIIRFLDVYERLPDKDQNLVLAFLQGMELQREISGDGAAQGGA